MPWCTLMSPLCCLRHWGPCCRTVFPSPVLMIVMGQGQGKGRLGSCLTPGKGSVTAGVTPHQDCQRLLLADHGSSL